MAAGPADPKLVDLMAYAEAARARAQSLLEESEAAGEAGRLLVRRSSAARASRAQPGAPVSAQREPANRTAVVSSRTPISAQSPHQTPTIPQPSASASSATGT
jgi:hypothetical protein